MTEFRSSAAPRPSEDAERESRHRVLIDLLGPYADGELPPESASQIEAHLVGCDRCRRELSVQRALAGRLAAEPPAAASPALRARIAGAVSAAPAPALAAGDGAAGSADRVTAPASPRRTSAWRGRRVAAAVALVAASAVGGALVVERSRGARPEAPSGRAAVARLPGAASAIPLLGAVVADYRRTVAGDLPGRARDLAAVRAAVPFPVEPLASPPLRLLAAWTTTIADEPAAVLAYRWDERLILQYFVAEQSFFRHSAVRTSIATHHHVAAIDGAQGVLAWAEPAAGSVLVADVSPELLGRVWAARRR